MDHLFRFEHISDQICEVLVRVDPEILSKNIRIGISNSANSSPDQELRFLVIGGDDGLEQFVILFHLDNEPDAVFYLVNEDDGEIAGNFDLIDKEFGQLVELFCVGWVGGGEEGDQGGVRDAVDFVQKLVAVLGYCEAGGCGWLVVDDQGWGCWEVLLFWFGFYYSLSRNLDWG